MERLNSFQPLKIPYGTRGKVLELKNRYMIPPMCSYSADDDARYLGFGMGGYGSVIVEATAVSPEGRISAADLGVWSDEHTIHLKKICDGLHGRNFKNVKVGLQLAHAGRKASTSLPWKGKEFISEEEGGFKLLAPSAIPFGNSAVPKEMSKDEIKEVIKKFVDAAERAKTAGFDFVELHGAHGYLANEFLCNSTNHRRDEYGGSFENRTRFLVEIVEGIQERLGEFPLFVRLSCDEGVLAQTRNRSQNKIIERMNRERWTIKDTLKLTELLIRNGVCFIDCSFGSVNPGQIWNTYPMYMMEYPKAIKKRFGDRVRTSLVGEISKAEEVERAIKDGIADVVQLGRQSLMEPYTPIHHAQDHGVRAEEILQLYVIQHSYSVKRLLQRRKKRKN